MSKQVPIREGLFTWPSEHPQLIGTRFRESGVVTFPQQSHCPKTSRADGETVLLPPRGRLWSWTIQGFPPKTPPYLGPSDPEDYAPFGVGYVQLNDLIIVESRLTVNEPERLQIGMQVELTVVPLTSDDQGNELVTFAFAPVEQEVG
jgi:uncharacterized OB-fold protein